MAAWLKGRTNREKQVFSELFEQSFLGIFTWSTQNCELTMDVLQCNIIQQMIFVLEGLVPYSKDIEQATTMSVAGSNEGEIKILIYQFFTDPKTNFSHNHFYELFQLAIILQVSLNRAESVVGF